MNDIYEKLRERLDNMATGYPITKSGVEIEILKRLFTEKDVELFLRLSSKLEKPADVAKRISRDADEVAEQMEEMARKGLLFRLRFPNSVQYLIQPFVPGILEFQVNSLDKELAKDLENYYVSGLGKTIQGHRTPVMRTIPINKEYILKTPVATFDDAVDLLNKQKTIKVGECLCRKWGRLVDRECEKPLETCFHFGVMADFYVENGMGRYVQAGEAVDIVRKNLELAPFVIQIGNAQSFGAAGGVMCMCCGDCCQMLRSIMMQPKPSEAVKSNYYARIDQETCNGCKVCINRCQMDAISPINGKAEINYDRCIGCGNCIATCATKSLDLIKKRNEELYTPPENWMIAFLEIAKERGKI
jgi:Na+-translocating ferredoxin:NAD+ oxidoreductase subunit B